MSSKNKRSKPGAATSARRTTAKDGKSGAEPAKPEEPAKTSIDLGALAEELDGEIAEHIEGEVASPEDHEADEPQVEEQEDQGPADSRPATILKAWPEGEPLPTHYQRPKPIPCRKCRAVRLDTLSRAVAMTSTKKSVAYFRCRLCGHRFSMAIKE